MTRTASTTDKDDDKDDDDNFKDNKNDHAAKRCSHGNAFVGKK